MNAHTAESFELLTGKYRIAGCLVAAFRGLSWLLLASLPSSAVAGEGLDHCRGARKALFVLLPHRSKGWKKPGTENHGQENGPLWCPPPSPRTHDHARLCIEGESCKQLDGDGWRATSNTGAMPGFSGWAGVARGPLAVGEGGRRETEGDTQHCRL